MKKLLKYGEETVMVNFRVPKSKKSEIQQLVNLELNEYAKEALLSKDAVVVENIPQEKLSAQKKEVILEEEKLTLDQIYDLQIVSKLPDIDDQVFIDKKQICLYDKYNQGVFYIKWEGQFLMFLEKEIFLKFCKDKEILLK